MTKIIAPSAAKRSLAPDWSLQISWFAAAGFLGLVFYFQAGKNLGAAIWSGGGMILFVLLAITFHIHNDRVRKKNSEILKPILKASHQQSKESMKVGLLQSSELHEAELASSDKKYSSMTMEEYFEAWYHKSTTSLQRAELERRMKDRRVIWNGSIKTIEEKFDDRILVTVGQIEGKYGTAFLYFDKTHRDDLAKLNENQRVRFTGVIRDFVASPFLSECTILQVLA